MVFLRLYQGYLLRLAKVPFETQNTLRIFTDTNANMTVSLPWT